MDVFSSDLNSIIQESKLELADIFEEHPDFGFAEAVEAANIELDSEREG